MARWTELYETNRNINIIALNHFVQETTITTEEGFTVVRFETKFLVLAIGVKKKTNNLVKIYNSNVIQKRRLRFFSDGIGMGVDWTEI